MKDKSKTRLCLVSTSLQLGGLERAMSNLANYYASIGLEVIYVLHYKKNHFYELDPTIKVIEPDFDKETSSKLSYYFRLIPYLRNSIKESKADVVLSFGDYHNPLVLLSATGLSIPIYISDRSSPHKKIHPAYNFFRKMLYRKSQGFIAQTSVAARVKRKMLGEDFNIKVIPNAVKDVKLYPEIQREKSILVVGRHYKVKGIDRAIEAFYRSNNEGWKLRIAGSNGPESEKLYSLVKELQLEDKVEFLGQVLDMDRLYAKSSIFLLTSRSEGMPNALCEAMASGLACISYDIIAGPSDLINNDENGILVEDGDIDQLVVEIDRLISDEKKRGELMSKAKAIRVNQSLVSIAEKYLFFIYNIK